MMIPWTRHKQAADLDRPYTKETPEDFLSRGGKITKCPPRMASATSMYTPSIVVDGYELPIHLGSYEYLPNFVRDLDTYDVAQADPVTPLDDGSTHSVHSDEQRALRANLEWHEKQYQQNRREGSDLMEETV